MLNEIYYKYQNHMFYMYCIGNITIKNCVLIKTEFMKKSITGELEAAYVNLEKCTYMDSTCMGILIGFNSFLKENNKQPLVLVSPSKESCALLQEMGIYELFDYKDNVEFPVELICCDKRTILSEQEVLEAHENLVRAHEKNRSKFKMLISLLKTQRRK